MITIIHSTTQQLMINSATTQQLKLQALKPHTWLHYVATCAHLGPHIHGQYRDQAPHIHCELGPQISYRDFIFTVTMVTWVLNYVGIDILYRGFYNYLPVTGVLQCRNASSIIICVMATWLCSKDGCYTQASLCQFTHPYSQPSQQSAGLPSWLVLVGTNYFL